MHHREQQVCLHGGQSPTSDGVQDVVFKCGYVHPHARIQVTERHVLHSQAPLMLTNILN